MWRPFLVLFIITTNLCALLDSYKITDEKISKPIQTHDHQEATNPREEYIEDNYSNEDSYGPPSNGRVVIGKWRNNGEALEPKWRDGDSVPLAPFSTISLKNGWRKAADSREEDYQIEPETYSENWKKRRHYSADQTADADEPEERDTANKNANSKPNRNSKPIANAFNSRSLTSATESNPPDRRHESRARIGFKNSHRKDRQFNRPDNEQAGENSTEGTTAEDTKDTGKEYAQVNQRTETLQNYPKDYELFENENDDPRPRKRRPPQHYEFPGSWSANDNRRVESYGDDEEEENGGSQARSQENLELKTFLKTQGDGLSLSEILQEKNLTLADLIKGKPSAINILKSNEKRIETTVQGGEANSQNSTRWSPRRKIALKSDKNLTFDRGNDPTVLNVSQASFGFETTTLHTSLMKTEETANNISQLINISKLMNDNETVSSEKFQRNPTDDVKTESDPPEFLKPLENRESLLIEATTVVEDGTEDPFNDRPRVSVSNERSEPASVNNNDDDDEIMEFSDYPAAKMMPKFIAPVPYETVTINAKRKGIPFSVMRRRKPAEDTGSKLNIDYILPPENKAAKIINETNVDDEDSRKIVNEITAKNDSVANLNEKDGESDRMKNKKGETPEKLNTESRPAEYGDESNGDKIIAEKIFSKDVKNDFTQNTKEESIKSVDSVRDQKNLALSQKFHQVFIPKVDPESRAEILELFSSGSSAERLERLLASRNMTIEELIALRQRGSSQVHFAEIFKAKEMQPSSLLPHGLKTNHKVPENYKEDKKSQRIEETTELIINAVKGENDSSNIEDETTPQSGENSTGNKGNDTEYLAADLLNQFFENSNLKKNLSCVDNPSRNFDTRVINTSIKSVGEMDLKTDTIENSDLTKTVQELSAGNNIQKDSEGSSYYTSIEAVKLSVREEERKKIPDIFREAKSGGTSSVSSEEIGRVEEILSNDLKSITNLYGINDHEFTEKKALSKVKPSIIASGGILGVTIVVFLAIFIACRIQQKKKFAYKNSFTKAVFHNPVMTVRKLSNTSSINTIMVDVVATSTTKRPQKPDAYESDDFEAKSDIDNDSLDANDSWDTIPDFMK